MRTLMAAGALLAMLYSPAAAFLFPERSQDAPWCLYYGYNSTVDCAYYNYQQCAITNEGLGGYCFQNPRVVFAQPQDGARHRYPR